MSMNNTKTHPEWMQVLYSKVILMSEILEDDEPELLPLDWSLASSKDCQTLPSVLPNRGMVSSSSSLPDSQMSSLQPYQSLSMH